MTKKNIKTPSGWPANKPWTEKDASEAMKAAGLGLSRSDFCDDAADLKDLKKIIEGGE
jgi:hypothetical protein|tara:strand:- start:199 stop:372 length:174 start_codon:yes stop_codon:yes gene_type:complete